MSQFQLYWAMVSITHLRWFCEGVSHVNGIDLNKLKNIFIEINKLKYKNYYNQNWNKK